MSYTIKIDDNFNYMDERYRNVYGVYETKEEAIKVSKAIVDFSLLAYYEYGMTPMELFDAYKSFGDDPFISCEEPENVFSAWTYAESRCYELCAGR